jgi:hypothetical protein
MEAGEILNLHDLSKNSNYKIQYTENHEQWLDAAIHDCLDDEPSQSNLIALCERIYEHGLSCIDVMKWINNNTDLDDKLKAKACIYFDTIRAEYRFEKMLMLSIFDFLYLRSNKDLKSITEI